MRPALHAGILRTRRQKSHRIRIRPHTFSMSRLMILVFVGAVVLIPGVALTVLGFEKRSEMDDMSPGQRMMYRAIGPAATALGVGLLFSAVVYYYCYGMADIQRRPAHKQTQVQEHAELVRGELSQRSSKNSNFDGGGVSPTDSHHRHSHHHHHHHHSHHHEEQEVPLQDSADVALQNKTDIDEIEYPLTRSDTLPIEEKESATNRQMCGTDAPSDPHPPSYDIVINGHVQSGSNIEVSDSV